MGGLLGIVAFVSTTLTIIYFMFGISECRKYIQSKHALHWKMTVLFHSRSLFFGILAVTSFYAL